MAEIVFNKDGNKWVAEFEVSADFNLHIEKPQIGYLYMQQRSTSGKWDSVHKFQVADSDYIVDYDFAALVYPKQIRLVSEYAPTMCVLTSDGDVIEIKSQSKEVEITQNGEMSVTPDDGFAYLSSVNVKTNVPQQGGGESGGGSSSGSEWVYLDVSNWDKKDVAIVKMIASYVRYEGIPENPPMIRSVASMGINSYMVALAINLDFPISALNSGDNRIMSLKEQMAEGGVTLTDVIPNSKIITKEEFYNLES